MGKLVVTSNILELGILVASLVSTILLFWLGLTVLLNAERRSWGSSLAGATLLAGGLFFLGHAAVVAQNLGRIDRALALWWPLAWAPGIALPLAWYVLMLWYSGYWDDRQTRLRLWHRQCFPLVLIFGIAVAALLLVTSPLPFLSELIDHRPTAAPTLGGIPLVAILYPLFALLCIALSIDVLRHPGPATRMMGELARRRARPWLAATSVSLLLASLLVGAGTLWLVLQLHLGVFHGRSAALRPVIAWSDLIISCLIMISVLLLGQAIVSYEIFTGKTLPRRGLRRHWHGAIILAVGYSAVMASSTVLDFYPIRVLLASTLLVTILYALVNWHSYLERERYIEHLRPFVAGPRMYEALLTGPPSSVPDVDMTTPFRALCRDLLGTRLAYLAATGPLSPLIGSPLAYPDDASASPPPLTDIVAQCRGSQTICVPLDPARCGGAQWAVPLSSERGLIGVLLLGEKTDGGLYTQEEMEIARATGERLIDAQASVEIARRLVLLQRQRMAESRILDRRTRRLLHDEVLPRLHAAMLPLSAARPDSDGALPDVLAQLADVHRQLSDLLREMPASSPDLARLGLVGALRRTVELEWGDAFDGVTWEIEPETERRSQDIPPVTAEVLLYATREAIRNAARHARGGSADRSVHLRIALAWRDGLEILVEDDGVGFRSSEESRVGRGQGLALHSTMMAVVGGSLAVESVPGQSTKVTLSLPQTS